MPSNTLASTPSGLSSVFSKKGGTPPIITTLLHPSFRTFRSSARSRRHREFRPGPRDGQAVLEHLHKSKQGGRQFHHANGLPVNDSRLIPLCRRRIDFSAGFLVGKEEIQADAGRQSRLPVFSR